MTYFLIYYFESGSGLLEPIISRGTSLNVTRSCRLHRYQKLVQSDIVGILRNNPLYYVLSQKFY